MTAEKWWLDKDEFQSRLDAAGSMAALARQESVSRQTLISAADRLGVARSSDHSKFSRGDKPGVSFDGKSAAISLPPGVRLGDIDVMLRKHGLAPSEWIVKDVLVNKWDALLDGQVQEMRQLKVMLKHIPSVAQIFPARDTKPVKFPLVSPPKRDAKLWVFTSCWQAPYHDQAFHAAFCKWLKVNKPDHGVDLGDLMDLPSISKHRDNPAYFASVQECVDSAYGLLVDRRAASPGTKWSLLEGNHDERLRTELLARAERMYSVRPATRDGDEPEEVLASIRRLLRLDELEIEHVATPGGGNYEHAEVHVSEQLVARHGWITGPNAASRTVEKIGRSVIVGHTHMQGVQPVPRYERGRLVNLVGVEVGCGCEVKPDGLGYAAQPRWVQGFATAWVWPDGEFHVSLARFENNEVRWQDQRVAA